jgi:hypothetical protein
MLIGIKQEQSMTIYSWFLRMKKKPVKKNLNDDLFNTASSASNIKNYTMWPTATIKSGIEVVLPKHNDNLDSSASKNNTETLPTKALIPPLK